MSNLSISIALVLIALIVVWRFWSKTGSVFLLLALFLLAYLRLPSIKKYIFFESRSDEIKEEIISFNKMSVDSIAGELFERYGAGKPDGNAIIYPAEMDEDYYKLFPGFPGKFIIAFCDGIEYKDFFKSIDSLKIQAKATGCPEGRVYKLSDECFVCDTRYKSDLDRFILTTSKELNFSLPGVLPPKRPIPPRPYTGGEKPKVEDRNLLENRNRTLNRNLGWDRQQGNPPQGIQRPRQLNPRQSNPAPQNPAPSTPKKRGGGDRTMNEYKPNEISPLNPIDSRYAGNDCFYIIIFLNPFLSYC